MKKELLIMLILLLVSFPAAKALLQPGGFTSHDLTHHVIRQIIMDKLLSEGQFPPRWSGELNNGYGYPLFLFNYPLPAMFGEVFHKLGFGFVDSVKAVLFSSMILSVLGMYLFLRSLLGSRMAAFLGAIFYLYAPIRFLNVYVSAAVGSALALAFVPFIFWSMVEIKKEYAMGKKWAVGLGSLSLAGLILAHNVTALMFAPVIIIFSIVCSRLRSNNNIRSYYKKLIVALLLGLGLSAWFWIPATLEKQYTRFDEIFGQFYKDQFPTVWQLLRSPWGYGLSHPERPEPGDMSYQLGLIHILVMLMLIPGLWFFRKISPTSPRLCGVKEIRVIGGFAVGLFAASVFLMLKISLPLWDSIPILALVQFPLRFSAIAIFCASLAAALLVKYLPNKKVIFVVLLGLTLYANRNHLNINQVFDPGEDYYLSLKTTSTTYGEHLPKWGRMMVLRPFGLAQGGQAQGKLEFVGGMGEIRIISDKSNQVVAEIEATEKAKLRFNQFYFPGWEIKVDGKPVKFHYLTEGESYGLPLFDINLGSHIVSAQFKNTPIRNLADGISLITLVILLASLVKVLHAHISR